MSADSLPSGEQAGELIVHRPKTLTAGVGRAIHVWLDDHQIADLRPGATARVSAAPGPHQLRARCLPLISGEFTFILAAHETLRLLTYVNALDELEIHPDNRPDPPASSL